MPTVDTTSLGIDNQLRGVLARFPALVLALVFGAVAEGRQAHRQ